jgi:hypothetical protein
MSWATGAWDRVDPQGDDGGPSCSSYRPGHRVHYIQARKAREEHGDGVPCRIVDLIEPDVVVLRVDGVDQRWHVHRLDDLRVTARRRGMAALYAATRMLRVGSRCVSIATPQGWEPDCATGPVHGFVLRVDPAD